MAAKLKDKTIVYNEDCMVKMKRFKDNHFDLAIVDPPYGISMMDSDNKSRGKLAKAKDYKKIKDTKPPDKQYFNEVMRISKNQIIWGANHFISLIPINSSCWIVWDKNNGTNDFADCELAWASFKTAVRIFRYTWKGMLQQNMKNKEERIHPTQKPIALYTWLLTNYAKEGDLILDTHLGSGSSRIAAYENEFDFVGFEIDKDYFDAQEKRFAKYLKRRKDKPPLFTAKELKTKKPLF